MAGIEPAREVKSRRILSPVRLPVPPHLHITGICHILLTKIIVLHIFLFVNTFFNYFFELSFLVYNQYLLFKVDFLYSKTVILLINDFLN